MGMVVWALGRYRQTTAVVAERSAERSAETIGMRPTFVCSKKKHWAWLTAINRELSEEYVGG
jgi:hypothetical protein